MTLAAAQAAAAQAAAQAQAAAAAAAQAAAQAAALSPEVEPVTFPITVLAEGLPEGLQEMLATQLDFLNSAGNMRVADMMEPLREYAQVGVGGAHGQGKIAVHVLLPGVLGKLGQGMG
jgi:hypothetical protein